MKIAQLPTLATPTSATIVPMNANNYDYGVPLGNIFKVMTDTFTTNTSANAALGLSADYVVLMATRTDSNGLCIPFFNISTSEWNIHVTTAGANPSAVTSTSVTVKVFYMLNVFA